MLASNIAPSNLVMIRAGSASSPSWFCILRSFAILNLGCFYNACWLYLLDVLFVFHMKVAQFVPLIDCLCFICPKPIKMCQMKALSAINRQPDICYLMVFVCRAFFGRFFLHGVLFMARFASDPIKRLSEPALK